MKGSILAEEGLHSVPGDSIVLQEFASMPTNAKDGHSSHSSIIQSRSQSIATYSFESAGHFCSVFVWEDVLFCVGRSGKFCFLGLQFQYSSFGENALMQVV